MVSLGGSFPPDYLRQQIARQLTPGLVIKLCELMDDGKVQEKRYVVVHVDDFSTCCVINSRIGPFLQSRPALLKCQVLMPVAEHTFMDHDSHVDCSRTKRFSTAHVVRELMAQNEWILGRISTDLCHSIVGALKFSPTLSPIEVEMICNAISPP